MRAATAGSARGERGQPAGARPCGRAAEGWWGAGRPTSDIRSRSGYTDAQPEGARRMTQTTDAPIERVLRACSAPERKPGEWVATVPALGTSAATNGRA